MTKRAAKKKAKRGPKLFSYTYGEYGDTVRIHEPRMGAPLRWAYRVAGKLTRPEVRPRMVVRLDASGPMDPVLVEAAERACKKKHAELTLAPAANAAADVLTIGKAFALYHSPRLKALPESESARKHHAGSRAFWEARLGVDTPWDSVPTAEITAALLELRERGQVATALKRLSNLCTLRNWLVDEMDMDLKDLTRGHKKLRARLKAGYTPRRPRLTPEQRIALRRAMPTFSWRTRMFFALLTSSGTRGVQARSGMRSGLNKVMEPPLPLNVAPHGWFLFAGVKGQKPHLTFLTAGQRAEIDAALAGPLAAWEAEYQAGTLADYPLVPSGRLDRGEMLSVPLSDAALRNELPAIFAAAGIKKVDRLGFHAIRRGWADIINARAGKSVTTSAGGWEDEDTVTTYLSRYTPEHIEQARRIMEEEEGQG